MMRKRRLWPPPRKREVMRPKWLRPPVRDICSVSDLTGSLPCVSSEKSGATRPRLPGVVGLCVRRPMCLLDSLEEFDVLARRRCVTSAFFQFEPLADEAAHALLLAANDGGAHVEDVDVPQLLDGVPDLDLVGVAATSKSSCGFSASGSISTPPPSPPVSLRNVPFSVRSGRLMICSGERMT